MSPENTEPTIAELEEILANNEPVAIALLPNGEVDVKARLTLTLDEAKELRASLHPLIIRRMMSEKAPAVNLADLALAQFDLRFEDGHFIPPGHYLDLIHSRIVPDGQYIHHITGEIVPVPEGKTYDRKTSRLE